MPLRLARCELADITSMAALEDSDTDSFFHRYHGTKSVADVRKALETEYEFVLKLAPNEFVSQVYLKVINERNEMLAFAEWSPPFTPWQCPHCTPETQCPDCIYEPIAESEITFIEKLGEVASDMYERVLKGRRYYELETIATGPQYRRQGAASMLVSWGCERADREGVICFLQTEADNEAAIALYEKMGFVKVDECSVSLELAGGEGVYTQIAMIREPKARGQSVIDSGEGCLVTGPGA